MLYYSNEARQSHIDVINETIKTISNIPGDKLDFLTASAAVRYLQAYRDLIEQELKSQNAINNLTNISNRFNIINKYGIKVKSMLSDKTYLVDVERGNDIIEVEAKIISLRLHDNECFADIRILKQFNYTDKYSLILDDEKSNIPTCVSVNNVKKIISEGKYNEIL